MHALPALADALNVELRRLGAASVVLPLPADQPPWTPCGLQLRRGQAYTLFGDGRVRWSARHPHLHGGSGFHLWARVAPGGRIVNVTRSTGSFVADVDGELELGIYLGMWRDAQGTLDTPPTAYARLAGGLEVFAIAWPGDAPDAAGEAALAGAHDVLSRLARDHAHPLLAAECARLAAGIVPPRGWEYLVETGTSDIWRACDTARRARICLDADDDQGIIRKPLDWPLTHDTVLTWRWRLDEHPSRVAEDVSDSHDYVSIALEFDNGRDLTWIWSSCLPPEHHFACPIRAWSARETHLVVRSGEDDAGRWLDERRAVHADVTRAMGAPPARIVAVWLIAVATFRHGRARAAFEDIRLERGGTRLAVL
ncbi:MAG: DUF3047 domain-containing protein [Gammaproteobacteria bacterium]